MTSRRMTGLGGAVASIGALAVVTCGAGVAIASNGGQLVLGRSNSASAVTSLANRSGTALALHAGHGRAPFTVSNSTQVKRLNASLLGGATAAQLRTSGSAAATNFPDTLYAKIGTTWTPIASTTKLSKGLYYATTSVMLSLPGDDSFAVCRLDTSTPSGANATVYEGGSDYAGSSTISETEPITVHTGQRISQYCKFLGSTPVGGGFYNAALTVIHVDSSAKGTVPKGVPVM